MTKKGKKLLIAVLIAVIASIGTGGAYAASKIAENNAIGKEAAQNFAYIDAGVLPDDVSWVLTRFDFENGIFVYDVEFIANGVKYDYNVKASDGMILARESKAIPGYTPAVETAAAATTTESAAAATTSSAAGTGASTQPAPEAATTYINVDDAKLAAAAHANVAHLSNVQYTKAKLERDDGRVIYDIEFYVGNKEYDYEIDALTGAILASDMEETAPAVTSPSTPETPAVAATSTPSTPAATAPSTPAVTTPTTPTPAPSTPAVTTPVAPTQPTQPSQPAYQDD
ncbi:MAG: PepSY domain-containing protein, partial [Lachnospiraceae bacterium]|nr:PepSY domain-containing protein [Lachnospiraceae bacterium]